MSEELKSGIIGKYVKPRTNLEYQFGEQFKCYIACSPKGKWRVLDETSTMYEILNSKGVIMEIPKRKFFDAWEICKSK